jgi:hypothetical protein
MSNVYITIDPEPVKIVPPVGEVVDDESARCVMCECCACLCYVVRGIMVLFLGQWESERLTNV